MKEKFYWEAKEQVDCFVVSDCAHSAHLQARHSFEFKETIHDEDHIFKLIRGPRSEEEVEAAEF